MFTLILLNTLIYFVNLISIQDTQHGVNNRTLIFDNNNLSPRSMEIADFSSPETDSGRAWLQPIGQEYEVEEVHLLRNAHLALHPNITRFVFIKFLLFYTCALVQNISFCPQFLRSEKRSCLYSVGCLWHSHGKNPVRLYPKLQIQPIGLPKIFIDYLFFQADRSDCTKSV